MGNWGWRPLVSTLFISVWVTGCSITSDAALTLSPTMLPQVTLTLRNREPVASPTPLTASTAATPSSDEVGEPDNPDSLYILRPGDTLLGIALDYGINVQQLRAANPDLDPRTLQVGQPIMIPPAGVTVAMATPVMLDLPPPTCYPLVTGSILCLGRVYNPQSAAVSQVRVQIALLDRAGQVLESRVGAVEQAVIPTQGTAPYSVIFDKITFAAATVTLASAQPAEALNEQWLTLVVENTSTHIENNRYQVEAQVHNQTGQVLGPGRIILTVFDSEEHIIGFRSLMLEEGFAIDETQTIWLESISQSSGTSASHTLYVEAPVVSP